MRLSTVFQIVLPSILIILGHLEQLEAADAVSLPAEQKVASADIQAVAGMSLEDLLNVTVTSASQKEQKLSDVAAAMTVLDADDIRRSGATNIPDLLRYVPGVEVGSANNSNTSVTIRGFGGIYATKLLVLVDGRSIYNPLYGGVDWQYQKMMMDNIERVEVIRGPGATVWGANAVNGVINIITKDAKDTQGGMVGAIYGTKEQGTGEFRYGFKPTKDLDIRVYGQYQNEEGDKPVSSIGRFDDCQDLIGGFRADYRPSSDDHFRLSGDSSTNKNGDVRFTNGAQSTPLYHQTGDAENLNFVYEHNLEIDNQIAVQSYYDRFTRSSDPTSQYVNATVETYDVQIRHSLPIYLLPIKQELVYGVEYREVSSHVANTSLVSWASSNRNDQTVSLFAQSDLHLVDDVLTLTLGSKYDHNDFTGNEVQPSARLLWKIDNKNSVWWSVSRAVREPAINEFRATAPSVLGNTNLKSEVLTAYEFGYRVEPTQSLSFDITCFYNDYDHLTELFMPSGSFVPAYQQFQKAQIYGFEPSFKAQVQPWWRLTGSYSLSKMHVDNSGIPGNYTFLGNSLDSVDPKNQFSLRSSFDLPNHIDIDLGGRYVDKVAGANGYFVADIRVGWRPTPAWEVSVVGQNLLMADHIENPGSFGDATYVSPEVYGKVVFKF